MHVHVPFYSEPILHNFTKLQFTWVVQYGFTERDIWADVLTNNVRQQEIYYFSLSMHFRHIGADIYRYSAKDKPIALFWVID